jgi:hypothetical protein
VEGLSNEQAKQISDLDASLAGLAHLEQLDTDLGKPYVLTSGSLGSEESQKLGSAVNALAPGVARATEGDAATKDSMDRAAGDLLSTDPGKRVASRAAYKEQLERKREAIINHRTGKGASK